MYMTIITVATVAGSCFTPQFNQQMLATVCGGCSTWGGGGANMGALSSSLAAGRYGDRKISHLSQVSLRQPAAAFSIIELFYLFLKISL